MGFGILPDKTDTPLIVDPYAHLADPVSLQNFQTVSGRVFKVVQRLRRIQLAEFPQGPVLNIAGESPRFQAIPDFFRFPAFKGLNHPCNPIVTLVRYPYNKNIQPLENQVKWGI